MARQTGSVSSTIYLVAERFRDNCLLRDGSLLSDDALWRSDNLERIHQVFVAAPDEGDRSFIDKFRDQIKGERPEVVRLGAELLCVYFLFPRDVGGTRKREVVSEVLGWAGETLPESDPVAKAFATGIGKGGQGYNTRRPFEVGFLIELAIAWKRLPPEGQAALANDPWQLQAFIDDIEDADARQLRHMLLHLLFPDHFEGISSGGHKRRIIAAFSKLVPNGSDGPEDSERMILAIRQALSSLLPGQSLDFYKPPLAQAWHDDSDGTSADAPLELIEHKRQIVLYGPPGTGKTFRAKRLAGQIIRSAALRQWGAARYFQSQSQINAAIKDNVHRLQLHPAYSYEDFIRALHISPNGATEYREGYLLKLIAEIDRQPRDNRLPHVLILDEMNRTDLSRMLGECFSLLEDRNETAELPAHDRDGTTMKLTLPDDLYVIGTMNLIDQSIEQIDFALRRRFLWLLCPFDKDALIAAAAYRWEGMNTGLAWERIAPDIDKLAAASSALNQQIHASPLLGPQYEIGHTYLLDVLVFLRDFLGARPSGRQNYLWNRRGEALDPVIQVWKLSLGPLLEQYLAGLEATARKAELDRLALVLLKPPVGG